MGAARRIILYISAATSLLLTRGARFRSLILVAFPNAFAAKVAASENVCAALRRAVRAASLNPSSAQVVATRAPGQFGIKLCLMNFGCEHEKPCHVSDEIIIQTNDARPYPTPSACAYTTSGERELARIIHPCRAVRERRITSFPPRCMICCRCVRPARFQHHALHCPPHRGRAPRVAPLSAYFLRPPPHPRVSYPHASK